MELKKLKKQKNKIDFKELEKLKKQKRKALDSGSIILK